MITWISRILIALTLCTLIACTQPISEENYNKISTGMSYEEVVQILGKPTSTGKFALGEISATTASWEGENAKIIIQFINNQVRLKNFDGKHSEQLEIE